MAEEIMNNENTEVQETENPETQTDTVTMSKEELQALIQSTCDARVTQALKTQQKKHEKEMSLANKDAEERAKIQLEDRNKELEEMIAQMKVDKARSDLKSTLSGRGLDARFADLLNITDDVTTNQKVISDFDKIWKASVQAEVNKRLAATETPKASTNMKVDEKNAKTMSLAEIAELQESNPDLFEKYFG